MQPKYDLDKIKFASASDGLTFEKAVKHYIYDTLQQYHKHHVHQREEWFTFTSTEPMPGPKYFKSQRWEGEVGREKVPDLLFFTKKIRTKCMMRVS